MRFSQNQGIEINNEVRNLLEKAIEREKSQNRLAIKMSIPAQNVQNWRGTGKRVGEYILWDQWERVRQYLVANGDIAAEDPRWMTPAEMRKRLLANTGLSLSDSERKLVEAYRKSSREQKMMFDSQALMLLANEKESSSVPSMAVNDTF